MVSSWKRDGDHLDLEVTVPANTRAAVRLPSRPAEVAESGRPLAQAEGVRVLKTNPERPEDPRFGVPIMVESGTYHFRMKTR